MSWSERRREFLLAAGSCSALLLAGCGFRPLYGRKSFGEVDAQLAKIKIGIIAEREGQQLHNYLLDRINRKGRPAAPEFLLSTTVRVTQVRQGFEPDASATRVKLVFTADFELQDLATGRILFRNFARSVASYNIVTSAIATRSAELDAIDRAARAASEEVRSLLALYFQRRAAGAAA